MDYNSPQSTQPWNTTAVNYPMSSGIGTAIKGDSVALTSPARDRISAAEQWLSDLNNIVDGFEKRLDTILTPVAPSGGVTTGGSPTPVQPKSHVVGRLDILCDGFSHLAQRMQHLANRIEL